MKKIIILMVCLWGLGNTFTSAQTTEKEKFISSLMKQMTLDEKIGQLAQCTYRGNFTGPDGGNIPKEEYVRQGRIGSMLNVIGVKDIKVQQKMWYGGKTVLASDGTGCYDCSSFGADLKYPDAIKDRTYRVICTHYADLDGYEEAVNDTGAFKFTY